MNLISKLKFGSDPEAFWKTDKGFGSPHLLLPVPKKILVKGEFGGVNRDGVAIELNPAPSEDYSVVAKNIGKLIRHAEDMAKAVGCSLYTGIGMTIAKLDEEVVGMAPRDVYELGCDPDLCAYTEDVNKINVDAHEYLQRFAGGHIHVQVGEMNRHEACELVKLFDYHAGLRSIIWSHDADAIERRKTYGRAGAFRHNEKDGIIEYRTPDAAWLWTTGGFEALCEGMEHAFNEFRAGIRIVDSALTIKAINECNPSIASYLLGK